MSSITFSEDDLPPFDVAGELQKMLDENTVEAGQRSNITAAINMYQKGELPKSIGPFTIFQDGKVCTIPDFHKGTPWWIEVGLYNVALQQ